RRRGRGRLEGRRGARREPRCHEDQRRRERPQGGERGPFQPTRPRERRHLGAPFCGVIGGGGGGGRRGGGAAARAGPLRRRVGGGSGGGRRAGTTASEGSRRVARWTRTTAGSGTGGFRARATPAKASSSARSSASEP